MRQISISLYDDEFNALEEARTQSGVSRAAFVAGVLREKFGMPAGDRRRGRPRDTAEPRRIRNLPPRHAGVIAANTANTGIRVVNGLRWADFDDPIARAHAIVELSGADRSDDPPVLPYRSAAGENPKSASVEALETTDQMWMWVDRYLLPTL